MFFCIFYKEHVSFLKSQNNVVQNDRRIGGMSVGGERVITGGKQQQSEGKNPSLPGEERELNLRVRQRWAQILAPSFSSCVPCNQQPNHSELQLPSQTVFTYPLARGPHPLSRKLIKLEPFL